MSLKYLSEDENQRIQQLNLLIHNCSVYGIDSEIKAKYLNELDKLEGKWFSEEK